MPDEALGRWKKIEKRVDGADPAIFGLRVECTNDGAIATRVIIT